MSFSLQTKARVPQERVNPNSIHLLPSYSPNPPLQWLPINGNTYGEMSVSISLSVHAEESGAAAFVLGPRLTHKWEEHSRQPFTIRKRLILSVSALSACATSLSHNLFTQGRSAVCWVMEEKANKKTEQIN